MVMIIDVNSLTMEQRRQIAIKFAEFEGWYRTGARKMLSAIFGSDAAKITRANQGNTAVVRRQGKP
jgi:hypothetical protein